MLGERSLLPSSFTLILILIIFCFAFLASCISSCGSFIVMTFYFASFLLFYTVNSLPPRRKPPVTGRELGDQLDIAVFTKNGKVGKKGDCEY